MQTPAKKHNALIRRDTLGSSADITHEHSQPAIDHSISRAQLQRLNSQFSQLYNQVDVENFNGNMYFNLITWGVEKQQSLKFDPQIVSSRLKQLQNKAQIGKANMELDKRHSPRKTKPRSHSISMSPNYKQVYEQELYKNPVFQQIPQNRQESNDESEDATKQQTLKEITHVGELKKRKKFMGYLLKRIKEPTNQKQEQVVPEFEHQTTTDFKLAVKKIERARQGPNPQHIIQLQYPKFFNRMNNQDLSQQIRQKPICKRLIKLHEQYIDNTPEISDQNKRKLQQKFNHIVREIAKSDRNPLGKKTQGNRLPRLPKFESQS